jgi:hypothetical protein
MPCSIGILDNPRSPRNPPPSLKIGRSLPFSKEPATTDPYSEPDESSPDNQASLNTVINLLVI